VKLESKELVDRVLAGDDDACERVVKLHGNYVRGILCSITRLDPMDIDDLYQEVFLRVFTKLSSFHQESELSTWVYSIARHVAFDSLRRLQYKRGKRAEVFSRLKHTGMGYYSFVLPDETNVVERAIMQEKINHVFNILTDDQQKLVILRAQGYTYKEIEECFDVKESTLKVRMFRLRRWLSKRGMTA